MSKKSNTIRLKFNNSKVVGATGRGAGARALFEALGGKLPEYKESCECGRDKDSCATADNPESEHKDRA